LKIASADAYQNIVDVMNKQLQFLSADGRVLKSSLLQPRTLESTGGLRENESESCPTFKHGQSVFAVAVALTTRQKHLGDGNLTKAEGAFPVCWDKITTGRSSGFLLADFVSWLPIVSGPTIPVIRLTFHKLLKL
jgi:hypothetical protein